MAHGIKWLQLLSRLSPPFFGPSDLLFLEDFDFFCTGNLSDLFLYSPWAIRSVHKPENYHAPHSKVLCSNRSTPWPDFCACAMLRDSPRFCRETWLTLYYAETTWLLSSTSRPFRKAKIFWISSIGRFTGCRGRGVEQRLEFINIVWRISF